MSSEQKQTEQQPEVAAEVDCERALKQWPVSLLGSLANRQATPANQGWWPWLLSKAIFCPAALLGANETLFQEEEPADICCLQPHSLCGPTCRDLNVALCGFGNEGLKLFVHTCALQAVCSCVCLGLPFVAWLAALQRQKVVGKHAVDDSLEDFWVSTAMYPCSLLQMHALLRQQQQPIGHAVATYRAPAVQQMTAVEAVAQAPSQAASMPGPLTSAITASRTMRAVQQQLAKSESVGLHKAAGSRMDGSISSVTSSGAVDSPNHAEAREGEDSQLLASTLEPSCSSAYTVKQHEQQHQTPAARALMQADGPLHSGPLSARVPRAASSAGGMLGSPAAMRTGNSTPASSAAAAVPVEMAPLSARRREQMQQQQQLSGPKGPGTPRVTTSRPQLPPKHRSSTSSLHKAPAAPAGVALGTSNAVSPVMSPAQRAVCAEASHSSVAHAEAEQSSTRITSQLYTSPSAGDADLLLHQHSNDAAGQLRPTRSSSSCGALANSKVSVGGSYNRLQLSHEDIPLMAIKPTPGRLPMTLNSSRSGKLSTANSWQQRSSGDKQLIPAGSCPTDQSANPSTASNISSPGPPADSGDARVVQQYQLQYATMQSDMCNYASWLGGMGVSTRALSGEMPSVQQQQLQAVQQQSSRGSSLGASRTSSALSEEQYAPPLGPQDSDLVVFGEPPMISPIGSGDHKGLATTAEQLAAARVAPAVSPSLQAGRNRTRMSDWAYMSDMCNLGSIAVDANSGLAAALGHLAEEGYEQQQTDHGADDEQQQQVEPQQRHEQSSLEPPPTASVSRGTVNSSSTSSQQQPVRPSVASGSWPDANPSPADTMHATVDSQRASSTANGVGSPATAARPSNPANSLDPTVDLKCDNAAAGQQLKTVNTSARRSTVTAPASNSRASSAAAARLDKETLAAVTGTTSREQLTASQEELAAKLAKLAFARKRPNAKQQQQKQQNQQVGAAASIQSRVQGSNAAAASTRVLAEDFYPTMMSDMCNLAEPVEGEGLEALQEERSTTSVADTSTQQLLSHAKAATAAQESMLQSFQQQHARPLPRRHYKPAGHFSGRASMQRKSLKIARTSAAGPLRSALLQRKGPAIVPPKPGTARRVGCPSTAPMAASPAAKHSAVAAPSRIAGGCPIESFDSYYPDCDLSLAANDVGGSAAGAGPDAPGKVTYVNPYYLYRDSTASSMVTGNTVVVSPPKSPKRAINRGHVKAVVAAIECQNAATAADDDGDDEVQSDLHLPWQQDNSRSASPAAGMASPKGRWPVVDASVEAKAR